MSAKKCVVVALVSYALMLFQAVPVQAVTIYFKDGTQMEVDNITRVGDAVCLFIDISKIDTRRTIIPNLQEQEPVQAAPAPVSGLSLEQVDFVPSKDDRDIIATGEVVNHSAFVVQNVRVIVTLKDKEAHKLLTVQGYVRPESLEAGQRGSYRLQVQKPEGFWKAGIDVQGEAVK